MGGDGAEVVVHGMIWPDAPRAGMPRGHAHAPRLARCAGGSTGGSAAGGPPRDGQTWYRWICAQRSLGVERCGDSLGVEWGVLCARLGSAALFKLTRVFGLILQQAWPRYPTWQDGQPN